MAGAGCSARQVNTSTSASMSAGSTVHATSIGFDGDALPSGRMCASAQRGPHDGRLRQRAAHGREPENDIRQGSWNNQRKLSGQPMSGNPRHTGCRVLVEAVLWAMEASDIPGQPPSRLPRRLGLFSAVAVLIGSTIGSGIFRSPAGIADKLPGPLPLLSVWIVGGLFALCGALTLAEVAAPFRRRADFMCSSARRGVGVRRSCSAGRSWSSSAPPRSAPSSTTFAEYLFRVMGHDPSMEPYATYVHWVAALAIALTATFNYVGAQVGLAGAEPHDRREVRRSAVHRRARDRARTSADGRTLHAGGAAGELLARAVRARARLGALGVRRMGGPELRRRRGEGRRGATLPRAIIIGTVAVIVIYLLANLAYLSVLDVEEIRQSRLVAADVAQRLIGSPGVVFVARDGDAIHVRHAQRVDPHGAAHFLRDGGRRAVLQADRGGASALPDAVRRDRARRGARRGVRAARGPSSSSPTRSSSRSCRFYALAVAAVFVLRKRRRLRPAVPRAAAIPSCRSFSSSRRSRFL